jgi:hypothetical protein
MGECNTVITMPLDFVEMVFACVGTAFDALRHSTVLPLRFRYSTTVKGTGTSTV